VSLPITREIAEIVAAMQVKALAFDCEHPENPLGTGSAADYARAIRALVPERDLPGVATLMAEASKRAVHLLMLTHADQRRPM
jgi:hypothetical protein